MTKNNQLTDVKSCVYCGSTQNITDDHIPPKNIFPKPRPNNINLIVVPACKKCNLSYSKDDEYFRLKLCMSEKVGKHPDALANQATIFRSLDKPEAKGLKKLFVDDILKVQVKTPGGLYLGIRTAFQVDLRRIFRVVERTVRGLYYYEKGHKLDGNCEVDVHSDDTLRENPSEMLEELSQKILFPLAQQSPKIVGNDTFMYRFHITEEDPCLSVWALTFYGQVDFLTLTGPSRKLESEN